MKVRAPSFEREKERERRFEDVIHSHAGYESSLIFNKFQWFGGSIPNEFRGTFLQRESKQHRSLDRAPHHRPLMHSLAHVILELPAPKEVSMIWDLNLCASFSSQDVSRFTRSRDRQSATNTPSYRCCPGSILSSLPTCATLPVHRSSPVLNAVELKVQIPTLPSTVWYFVTPLAHHRDSLIATIPRTGQNFQCGTLLP
jgi:hypothetical protein